MGIREAEKCSKDMTFNEIFFKIMFFEVKNIQGNN